MPQHKSLLEPIFDYFKATDNPTLYGAMEAKLAAQPPNLVAEMYLTCSPGEWTTDIMANAGHAGVSNLIKNTNKRKLIWSVFSQIETQFNILNQNQEASRDQIMSHKDHQSMDHFNHQVIWPLNIAILYLLCLTTSSYSDTAGNESRDSKDTDCEDNVAGNESCDGEDTDCEDNVEEVNKQIPPNGSPEYFDESLSKLLPSIREKYKIAAQKMASIKALNQLQRGRHLLQKYDWNCFEDQLLSSIGVKSTVTPTLPMTGGKFGLNVSFLKDLWNEDVAYLKVGEKFSNWIDESVVENLSAICKGAELGNGTVSLCSGQSQYNLSNEN
ncbi:hypothetical protein HDU80_002331 [Chytriomyces hyalinus]|nr:hypothetical protein HDU80_002331 [Chytriomyces hyalinus]